MTADQTPAAPLPVETTRVLIIGAGPAGAVAAALLNQRGHQVLVLERQQFPRFSIGESLLPQSMAFLEQAGMVEAVAAAGFQYKDGAAFRRNGQYTDFDFTDKFSAGPGTTYQVQRARFDQVLADEAARQGVEIRYQHSIIAADMARPRPLLTVAADDGRCYQVEAEFVLDASGFGRVLPRLLDLETPSGFPTRQSIFTHIEDGISDPAYDRNKILISVHPERPDVWYWLIPFPNGICSLGVVAEASFFAALDGDNEAKLRALIGAEPDLARLLANARLPNPVNTIHGYAANVKTLCGDNFALLGNAGEFLDPVFSSGVTIALKSATLAAAALDRQLCGETVDWQADYARPLKRGVDTFRVYVEAWYDGRFQQVIFHPEQQPAIKRMVCSILAGYAWDESNPYAADAPRRFAVLAELCAQP